MESMDNLIADGSMPVCIGIFISPGIVPAPHDQAQPRFNRSFEYDALEIDSQVSHGRDYPGY